MSEQTKLVLDGMKVLAARTALAASSGRVIVYQAVSKTGQAITIYDDGTMDGFDTAVVLNRLPLMFSTAWQAGHGPAPLFPDDQRKAA